MSLLICGIDIGKSGVASILRFENGTISFVGSVQLKRDDNLVFHKYKKNETEKEIDSSVNLEEFVLGLENLIGRQQSVHFYIEKQFRNQSTLRDEGTVIAACSMFKFRNPQSSKHVLHLVQPREWMKVLQLESGKPAHVEYVKRALPNHDWSKLKHDEADAICLGLYGLADRFDIQFFNAISEEEE